jgi:hypothetical protein
MSTLDQLQFKTDGNLRALVTAEATFFLRAWDDAARLGVLNALRVLRPQLEPHLTYGLTGSARRPAQFSSSMIGKFEQSIRHGGSAEITLQLRSGDKPDTVGPWSLMLWVDPSELAFSQSGYFRFTLPAHVLTQDASGFRTLIRSCAEQLHFESGHAGYGVSYIEGNIDARRNAAIRTWASRYHGIDLEEASSTTMWGADHVKGVNWLTCLSDRFCDQLGGRDKLAEQLSGVAEIEPLRHGVIIVAGAQPALGDANRAEFLPAYAAVSKLIRPLRMDQCLPLVGMSREQTEAWLARFDNTP